jgi:tetratricopeptide (TPR) repeat protein
MKYLLFILINILLITSSSCLRTNDVDAEQGPDSLAKKDSINPQISALSNKIKKDPSNPDNYFIRSNVFVQLNNLPAAFKDISQAIALDSTNLKYYFAIADVYLNGGSADGAIDAFRTIIRLDPKNVDAIVKLSKVYFYKKDYKNSLNELTKVQELDENNSEPFFIMGMNFKEMGDTARALASFQKAIQVKPDFYDAYMQLALLSSRNAGSQAPKYFDNAIRLDSFSSEAYYGKGKFYQDHDELEKAKTTYMKLIAVDPQYENAYFNLGFIYIKQDSIDKAYRMFDYAIKVKPTYAEAYYYRGLCSLEKENTAQAAADFRQAITLKPKYEAAEKELAALTQNSN